jgi:hypothetical protein
LPYVANSTVVDNNAGQARIFATGADASTYGTVLLYAGTTNGTATLLGTVGRNLTFALQGATQSAGTGIAFPATQSASSDANTLDDYEEGSWTPTDASGAGLTFAGVTSARYTKIGRCVFVDAEVGYPPTASGASAVIGGLPFTSKNTTDYNSGTCMNDANLNIWSFINANTTNMLLYLQATSFTSPTNAQLSGKTLYISIWYSTAY